MEKKYALYTTDETHTEHSLITDLTPDELAEFVKIVLKKTDPNKPVDLTIRPYIKF